ncbi:MAG: hypothetical protein JSR67_09825 [Proteobacteria bacterium]|nr:hypothetical protein [Pseudomonadota bacterium]
MTQTTLSSLNLDPALAAAGDCAASFAQLSRSIWEAPYLSGELLELCRLTLARLHRDAVEIAAGSPGGDATPDARRREAVLAGTVARSNAFNASEKAILDFCETYALDAQAITDEQAGRVRDALGEAGLVFLIEALGLLDARMRTARCLRDLAGAAAP